jgi:hypothetical protein
MLGFVDLLLLAYYGRTFNGQLTESDVPVGTSAVQLVKSNPQRFWVSFANNGAATIVISNSRAVAAGAGWPIPAGGALGFSWVNDADLSALDWYAISAAAGNDVHVLERIASGENDAAYIQAK